MRCSSRNTTRPVHQGTSRYLYDPPVTTLPRSTPPSYVLCHNFYLLSQFNLIPLHIFICFLARSVLLSHTGLFCPVPHGTSVYLWVPNLSVAFGTSGCPMVLLGTYGYLWVPFGTPLSSRYLWVPLGTSQYLSVAFGTSGYPRVLLLLLGTSVFLRVPCVPLGALGYPWVPLVVFQYLRLPFGTSWYLSVRLGTSGYPLVPSLYLWVHLGTQSVI